MVISIDIGGGPGGGVGGPGGDLGGPWGVRHGSRSGGKPLQLLRF